MVAIRDRTFKKPWQRSCLSSILKSSSAPIGRDDSWCFHAVGSSNAPLLGSTAAEGLPRIGRTPIATHWRSCGLPQSASCSENFVIPPDVFGQTLSMCRTLNFFRNRGGGLLEPCEHFWNSLLAFCYPIRQPQAHSSRLRCYPSLQLSRSFS